MSVCEREKERERERVCVCVCVDVKKMKSEQNDEGVDHANCGGTNEGMKGDSGRGRGSDKEEERKEGMKGGLSY
jgi:hypothetical protein